jgi:inorganic pyrophosphatase
MLGGAERCGESLPRLGQVREQLIDLRVVRSTLGLEERVGVRGVLVMTEQLLFELRTGTLEGAGQLLDEPALLGSLPQQGPEGLLPLAPFLPEALFDVRFPPCGVGRGLLRAQDLPRRLGPDRRDASVVLRRAGCDAVQPAERLHQQRPGTLEGIAPALRRAPVRSGSPAALRGAGEATRGAQPASSGLCPVGIGAVQPGSPATGHPHDGHVASVERTDAHLFGHFETVPRNKYRLRDTPPVWGRGRMEGVAAGEEIIDVIVEIPAGSRNKYEYDHDRHVIRLDRRLATATTYPADYGFVPDTLALDGDPLDALVILDDPTFPGCLVRVRVVGVFFMKDEAGPDAKLLTVLEHDPIRTETSDVSDLPPHLLDEIGHFFTVYKALEPGKETQAIGFEGRDAALEELRASRERFNAHAAG